MVPQEQESLIWLKLSQLRLIQRSSGRQFHIHYALLVPFNLFCVHYFHLQQNHCVPCFLVVYFNFHKLEAFVVSLARPLSQFAIWDFIYSAYISVATKFPSHSTVTGFRPFTFFATGYAK
jgi:hypothetical protein